MGSVISTEARAFNNEGRTGLDFFTPNINIFRDPRRGRGQETPGEDPFLTSEYVYALIDDLQRGDDDRYLKIAADCKHYAAYDLENSNGTSRTHFNAIVSDQDLVETYLPPFETCIRDTKVVSIMCSYNSINGIPACVHRFLLQTIARYKQCVYFVRFK
jgi:beta-D-xylosidase 4